jgi:hypothetical protein
MSKKKKMCERKEVIYQAGDIFSQASDWFSCVGSGNRGKKTGTLCCVAFDDGSFPSVRAVAEASRDL